MRRLLGTALVFLAGACSHAAPVGELRFHNQAPVWRVNDRTPIANMPREREYNRTLYHVDGFGIRRATRAMEVRDPVRAQDVNALDEVPDSTWFTNRIGVRELSLDELRRGANEGPSPFDHRPWKITGAKIGGMSIGFTFEDTRGDKYILKFDKPEAPEMETGAHAIVHRILWAIGYHVPEDYVGYIERSDLVIEPGATFKRGKEKVALDTATLDANLAKVFHEGSRYRVLASRFLPGKPLGPFAREGVRADDPNDTIPHENRRSLRGQFPIFSWLNHSDIQEDQSLDVFIADDPKDKRSPGYVRHYILDFGKALGTMGYHLKWQTVGHTYRFDWGLALKGLVTLGLAKRPWDGLDAPGIRGIGLYDVEHYEPGNWRPNSFYWPLEDADRHDAFWGAKLLMRFTREQLAAIVDEAQYTDPRAKQYMLDTLVARQRATARYWFDRVAPIDHVAVEPEAARDDLAVRTVRVCFSDLLIAYDLRRVATRYELSAFDANGTPTSFTRTLGSVAGGRTCANGVPLAPGANGYTILSLTVRRNALAMPPVLVHLATDERGKPRVIGLRRR